MGSNQYYWCPPYKMGTFAHRDRLAQKENYVQRYMEEANVRVENWSDSSTSQGTPKITNKSPESRRGMEHILPQALRRSQPCETLTQNCEIVSCPVHETLLWQPLEASPHLHHSMCSVSRCAPYNWHWVVFDFGSQASYRMWRVNGSLNLKFLLHNPLRIHSLEQGQQTMAHGTNPAHCLFW